MKLKQWLLSLFTFALVFSGAGTFAEAADVCAKITPTTKIFWNGIELKAGQIGRLTIVNNTTLVKKQADGSFIKVRTLKAGENYRIYAFLSKPQSMLGVGAGHYVIRDSKVKYETPSTAKLQQNACKSEAIKQTNSVVKLGQTEKQVEALVGNSQRVTTNEYGLQWKTYHQGYKKFVMASFLNGTVSGLYTNTDQAFAGVGLKNGMTPTQVTALLGTPISTITKGNIRYGLSNGEESKTYSFNNSYITVFFDLHNAKKVTAYQVVSKDMEARKPGFYGNQTAALQAGFEYQLFDLVNSIRVRNGLGALKWNAPLATVARNHSIDMAKNNFFDHTNLKGESPFDRMRKGGLNYRSAGENIAMGQMSSIFAHEGLMNSKGHRDNILQAGYMELGTGVSFQGKNVPFYTQNFLSK